MNGIKNHDGGYMVTRYLRRLLKLLSRGYETFVSRGPDRAFFLAVRYLSWKIQFQKRVSTLPPRVNLVITTLVLTSVRMTIRLFRLFVSDKYTDADPYAIRYVDPDEITGVSPHEGKKRRGWVIDGDWDQNVESFDERPIPKAIRRHFCEGVDWHQTELADQYDDENRFRRKCERIERLHDRIVADGYRTQRELLDSDPEVAWAGVNATMSSLTNEITVDIGQDGEIFFNMLGKHRLSIAKVLNIDHIPVQVFYRHTGWQAIRDQVGNDEPVPDSVVDHPDLTDLRDE